MKVRAARPYLIIGNVHLGYDEELLKALSTYAEIYKAQVIHLGNICTDEEKRMYERRLHKLKTFENISRERESNLCRELKEAKEIEKRERLFNKIDTTVVEDGQKRQQMEHEVTILLKAEMGRISKLREHFPNIKFVANDEQYLLVKHFGKSLVGSTMEISKHLLLQGLSANGPKVSSQPITDRAYNYLKLKKKSVIMPHPSPALRSFHREGLNKAWNMYTTGCLFNPEDPKRPSEFHQAVHIPSGLMVLIDKENDEFHTRRLHFDAIRDNVAHRIRATILEDGRAFSASSVIEVGGKDMAIFSTDDHAPHEHMGVLAACRSLQKLSEAETFINGGDAANWDYACPHNKGKSLYQENVRADYDIMVFARILAAQSESPFIKDKVLIDANHEWWIERLVAENNYLKGTLDQKTIYANNLKGWTYHLRKKSGDYTYYFGDLAIRHGDKENGLASAARNFHKYICGHVHAHDEHLRCATAGAGCGLGPNYLENNLTKWQNTISTITRLKGISAFDIKSVLHDEERKVSRFSWRDQIIEVPYHSYDGKNKKRLTA